MARTFAAQVHQNLTVSSSPEHSHFYASLVHLVSPLCQPSLTLDETLLLQP